MTNIVKFPTLIVYSVRRHGVTAKTADRLHVTFDEDVNNLSLGVGNEGNHVVLVVIPNPPAVK